MRADRKLNPLLNIFHRLGCFYAPIRFLKAAPENFTMRSVEAILVAFSQHAMSVEFLPVQNEFSRRWKIIYGTNLFVGPISGDALFFFENGCTVEISQPSIVTDVVLQRCLTEFSIGAEQWTAQFNHRDIQNRLTYMPSQGCSNELIFKAVKMMQEKGDLPKDPYVDILSDLDYAFEIPLNQQKEFLIICTVIPLPTIAFRKDNS